MGIQSLLKKNKPTAKTTKNNNNNNINNKKAKSSTTFAGTREFRGFRRATSGSRGYLSLPVRRRHFRRRHSGGITISGVTSGFRKRRRCTEAASVTPSPLVFRSTRNQDLRRRRRRRRRRCRQITLFL